MATKGLKLVTAAPGVCWYEAFKVPTVTLMIIPDDEKTSCMHVLAACTLDPVVLTSHQNLSSLAEVRSLQDSLYTGLPHQDLISSLPYTRSTSRTTPEHKGVGACLTIQNLLGRCLAFLPPQTPLTLGRYFVLRRASSRRIFLSTFRGSLL